MTKSIFEVIEFSESSNYNDNAKRITKLLNDGYENTEQHEFKYCTILVFRKFIE